METKIMGDITVIYLMKRFDAYTAGEVEAKLTKLIEEGTCKII